MNTRLLLIPVYAQACPTCESAEHVRLKRAADTSWWLCSCVQCGLVACSNTAIAAVISWNKGDVMQVTDTLESLGP